MEGYVAKAKGGQQETRRFVRIVWIYINDRWKFLSDKNGLMMIRLDFSADARCGPASQPKLFLGACLAPMTLSAYASHFTHC